MLCNYAYTFLNDNPPLDCYAIIDRIHFSMTNYALKMSRPGLRALKIAITPNLTVREGARIDAPTNVPDSYY